MEGTRNAISARYVVGYMKAMPHFFPRNHVLTFNAITIL